MVHRLVETPANRITLVRAALAVLLAVLVARSFWGAWPATLATSVAILALVLDGVDGAVARRTGTVTDLGARLDLEVDAFLILVLSVAVASEVGWWVLLIGLMRYLLLVATWWWPWLAEPLPPRYWCKVVAVVQGVVLTVGISGVLPTGVLAPALLVALALLLESFGRQVHDLVALHRQHARPRGRMRLAASVVAGLLVWAALALPDRFDRLHPGAFVRIPVEALVVVGLALLVGPRVRSAGAIVLGMLLGALVVLKVLDMGFYEVFDRPFDTVNDWYYLGPGLGVLRDSSSHQVVIGVVGVVLLLTLCFIALPWAVRRVACDAARHRRTAAAVLGVVSASWVALALAGAQTADARIASSATSSMTYDEVSRLRADLIDRSVFAKQIAADDLANQPGLLRGLRGKDVLVVFVESYGRIAVQDSTFAPGIDKVLDQGNQVLAKAGFGARSAFLTSPTFGAGSWLAHATLQSGLWVDSQQRYDQLLTAHRMTLTSAFRAAGWRTVFDVPAVTKSWAEGQRFYDVEKLYDATNVGYRGPRFSYATMPDQYTLAQFAKRELTPRPRRPVMAEIDLVSSHHPWTPLPHLVPWRELGDGSVFDPMPAQGESPDDVFRDPDAVRRVYGESVQYSWRSIYSFLRHVHDPNLVLVVLGDHQPHHYVSGDDPGHDVPVSVIAHDPAVLDTIDSWGWQPGLHPGPDAPLARMDSFRDRFFAAFSR